MTTVRRWNELVGLFLLACAGLLFEITATKIFEYSVWANYAYLVISTCMFGMGFAGVLMTRFPHLLRLPAGRFLPAVSLAMGGGILVGFFTMNSVPIHLPDAPDGWVREMANVGLVFLGLSLPFFFFGLTISYLFENRGKRANVYYFADLLGAGLGAFLLVPLIRFVEPQGIVWLCMSMSLAAGAILLMGGDTPPTPLKKSVALLLLAVVLVGAAWGAPRAKQWVALKVHIEKRTYLADQNAGRIEKSGWSALGRVDIASDPRNENIKRVWIAGGVNWSAIAKFDGDFEKARGRREELIERHSRILLYHLLPHLSKTNHTVCVIGTSGGEDALLALMYGARKVVGVEMDPEIVRFVTEDYRDYAGGLFTDGDYSEIVVDEGRSYLRRSGRKFDVIQQVNNFTPIALQNGAMNLSETYLLTVESFREFYDHLTDDGILAISRYGAARNLSIAVEMFRRMGMAPDDYSRRLIVTQGPRPEIPTMMMKRSPFTPEEVDAVFAMYAAGAHGKRVLYAPYRTKEELPDIDNNIYYMLATSDKPQDYWRVGCFDYSPTTDNRPFFNRMMRLGVKDRNRRDMPFAPEESIMVEPRSKIGRLVPKGDLPPLLILLESMILAALFLGVPLLSKKELRDSLMGDVKALGYFACLGMAFIVIEICLMQRLILFLGSPVYSISTVLGSLLISAGLGSLVSGRFAPTQRNVRRLLWTVAATVLAIHLIMPAVTSAALGFGFFGRLLVSIALCCSAGFMMGMPMPTGIRLLTSEGRHIISWGWAINSFFTVVGSASAVIVASIFGFGTIFFIATALYAVAPLFLARKQVKT